MAVVKNKTTAEGDILIIKPEIPRVGILSLTSFVDQTTGETPTDYFNKEFRYSVDGGMKFTKWFDLSTQNIQGVTVQPTDNFVIELKYDRVGSGDEVSFNNSTINGTFQKLEYPHYQETPFAKFFDINDINVYGWALNVLEKLMANGILPEYIVRNKSEDIRADEDFVAFFYTVTQFFAILVYYARHYEDILNNVFLLGEYLKVRGLYLCRDLDIQELIYLTQNLYSEYQFRGTRSIIRKRTSEIPVDGELLRLICYNTIDEFIFALTKRGEVGWCIGKSSPMFKGSNNIINLNKAYDKGPGVTTFDKYPLINKPQISFVTKKVGTLAGRELITNGDFSNGLNGWDITVGEKAEAVTIDGKTACKVTEFGWFNEVISQILSKKDGNWQVEFEAKAGTADMINIYRDGVESGFIQLTDSWQKFSMEVHEPTSTSSTHNTNTSTVEDYFYITNISVKSIGYDIKIMKLDGNGQATGIGDTTDLDKVIPIDRNIAYEVSFRIQSEDNTPDLKFGVAAYNKDKVRIPSFTGAKIGQLTNYFLDGYATPLDDNIYWIRGIIYPQTKQLDPNDLLNIKDGNNLIFPDNCEFIMPIVEVNNSVKYVWDLAVRPLQLPCSRGVMGARNYTFMYAKNRGEYSTSKIDKIIDRDLVSYNQFVKTKWL